MIANKVLKSLMKLTRSANKTKYKKLYDEAREEYENLSAVDYSEAAQRYEMCLAKYLSKHRLAHKGVDDALKFYTDEYPVEKNLRAYGQKSSVESGAVGENAKKIKKIIEKGTLREKISMICNFSSFVMQHGNDGKELIDKNNVKRTLPESDTFGFAAELMKQSGINFERSKRVAKTKDVSPTIDNNDQRFKTLEGKEHILADISQGLRTSREVKYFFQQNPNFAKSIGGERVIKEYVKTLKEIEEIESKLNFTASHKNTELETEKLKQSRKMLKSKVKKVDEQIRKRLRPGSEWWDILSDSENFSNFNNSGLNLIAGPSATTRTIYVIAQKLKLPKNIYENLRLGILSMFIMERHHSFHEVMLVTNKMFHMPYDDNDKRYRNITPLTENELRKNVTENKVYYQNHPEWKGKFPDELGKSIMTFNKKIK